MTTPPCTSAPPGSRADTNATGTSAAAASVAVERRDRQVATLAAQDGPLCEPAACVSLVPPVGSSTLSVKFTLVPPTSGPLVPALAIQTDRVGGSFVVLADSTRRSIRVVAVDGGLAIVDGLDVGETIALP